MAACTQGIRVCAWNVKPNLLRQTNSAYVLWSYPDLLFCRVVMLQKYLLLLSFPLFLSISHNLLMKIHKNIQKSPKFYGFFTSAFWYLDIRWATTLLAMAANTDKCSPEDAFFNCKWFSTSDDSPKLHKSNNSAYDTFLHFLSYAG